MDWIEQPLDYWRAGGPLLVPIAMASVGIWVCFLRMRAGFSAFSVNCRGAEGYLASLSASERDELAAERRAFEYLKKNGEREVARLSRSLVVLAALTAIAPLLGLLGTVEGMIDTFRAVADVSGDTAQNMSNGISSALITTQLGLIVAIPGLFGLARLQRVRERVLSQLDSAGLHILRAQSGSDR